MVEAVGHSIILYIQYQCIDITGTIAVLPLPSISFLDHQPWRFIISNRYAAFWDASLSEADGQSTQEDNHKQIGRAHV